MGEGRRQQGIHDAANYSFHPLEKKEEDSDLHRDVRSEDINIGEYVMGLRYFPQLEAAMRKVNFKQLQKRGSLHR